MIDHGDFAAHRRDGDDVIKVLHGQHPAGARFVAAAQNVGVTGMTTYLSTLRTAGVTLPPHLSVVSLRPLAVRHRWVTGPVLLDCASADPSRFIDAVIEIAQWVRVLDATDARLDTNLANFCLAEDRVVLLDVLPPLIPSVRPEQANLFEALFTALCFDSRVILDALIGYAARALLPVLVGSDVGSNGSWRTRETHHCRNTPATQAVPVRPRWTGQYELSPVLPSKAFCWPSVAYSLAAWFEA
jgi:hypothetical protein